MIVYHLTPKDTLDMIRKNGLHPLIGPRSKEFGETIPGIYTFPDAESLEEALGSWVEDVFDPEAPLACLLVDCDGLRTSCDVEYEIRIEEAVPRERVLILSLDIWEEHGIPGRECAVPICSEDHAPSP